MAPSPQVQENLASETQQLPSPLHSLAETGLQRQELCHIPILQPPTDKEKGMNVDVVGET